MPHWHVDVAVATTKAWRFVDEMREIASTQAGAGLVADLFEGVAAAYDRAAGTALGARSPEDVDRGLTVDEAVDLLRAARPVDRSCGCPDA